MRIRPLLAILPILALAASISQDMPCHRFRKVGDRHYDLLPIYSWLSSRKRPAEQPMPAWFVTTKSPLDVCRVIQILPGGLLIDRQIEVSRGLDRGFSTYHHTYFLVHYPSQAELTDGQPIQFIALTNGNYRYQDTAGALRTVAAYDYGIPFDQAELIREHGRTNSPARPKGQPSNNQQPSAPGNPTLPPR